MSNHLSYHRRHLPHYYLPNVVYFVTTRLSGTVPRTRIEEAREQRQFLSSQLKKPADQRPNIDSCMRRLFRLDKLLQKERPHHRWLADPRIANLVAEAIHYRDGRDYDLAAFTIMPNHVHLVFGIGDHELFEHEGQINNLSDKSFSLIMHSLKRHTAREANKLLHRSGAFWQDESYDHIVRDGDELERIVQYVLNNPVKAGLVKKWRDWKWSYSRFED